MAPPHKKRRLLSGAEEEQTEHQIAMQQSGEASRKHVYNHQVEELGDRAYSQLLELTQPAEGVDVSAHVKRQDAAPITVIVSSFVTVDAAGLASTAASIAAIATDLPTSILDSSIATPSLVLPSSELPTDLPSSILPASVNTEILSSAAVLASIDSATPTTSTPLITSTALTTSTPGLTSVSRNVTLAADALTSGLPSSFLISLFPTGTGRPSGYFNSSLTYSSPTLTSSVTMSDAFSTSIFTSTTDDAVAGATNSPLAGTGSGSETPTDTTAASSPPPPPPGTIAGGVVGGAAGLAVLLLVAMLFLRWYRKRAQGSHQALLTPAGVYKDSPGPTRSTPGMAESAGARPWAAIPGLFRHQRPHQFSPPAIAATPRSFERVSGRKLPSQWSPGMEGPPGMLPYRGSGYTSVYPESQQNAGNPFSDDTEDGAIPSRQSSGGKMNVVDGPERRPTFHHPRQHLEVAGGAQSKHMSSVARTSGLGISSLTNDRTHH